MRDRPMVSLSSLVIPKGLQTGPFGSQLKADEYTEDGVPVVMPKDIYGGKITVRGTARVPEEKAKKLTKHRLVAGDILFPRRGNLGRIAVVKEDNEGWLCGSGCLRARLKGDVNVDYIHQYVQLSSVKQWLESNALGQTMLNLNTEIIGKLPIFIVPIEEQVTITDMLSTWDFVIEKYERLTIAKEKQLKGLIKKHLVNNPEKRTWGKYPLGNFVIERNEKSTVHNQYPIITSSRRGIFLQEEYFSKQVTSIDNSSYKIIKKGDFTYRSMSDDGIFVFNRLIKIDIGLVSPAYGVFYANGVDPDYLYYFLNSSDFKKALIGESQGGTRTALKLSAIKKIKVGFPIYTAQKTISAILNNARLEIDLLKKQLESYKKQKRGLMQKLLTGQWRVKVDKPEVAL